MTQSVYVNRPWISSFDFDNCPFSDKKLDQLHKLSRNFVASLDLGGPMKLVHHVDSGKSTAKMDQREKYLEWVRAWKVIYKNLTKIIRALKTYRRTVRFPKLKLDEGLRFENNHRGTNETPATVLRRISEANMDRLIETAQILLNARYNAKLAAAEARRRSLKV